MAKIGQGGGATRGGRRWDIAEGADVVGAEGDKVGEVTAVRRSHVVVEEGFFFPTTYYIPMGAIADYDGEKVRLAVTKEAALDQGWEVAPADPTEEPIEPPVGGRFGADTGMDPAAPPRRAAGAGSGAGAADASAAAPEGATGDPAVDRGVARSAELNEPEGGAGRATGRTPGASSVTFTRAGSGGSQAETYAVGTNTDTYPVPDADRVGASDPSGASDAAGTPRRADRTGETSTAGETEGKVAPVAEVGTPFGLDRSPDAPAGSPSAGARTVDPGRGSASDERGGTPPDPTVPQPGFPMDPRNPT